MESQVGIGTGRALLRASYQPPPPHGQAGQAGMGVGAGQRAAAIATAASRLRGRDTRHHGLASHCRHAARDRACGDAHHHGPARAGARPDACFVCDFFLFAIMQVDLSVM